MGFADIARVVFGFGALVFFLLAYGIYQFPIIGEWLLRQLGNSSFLSYNRLFALSFLLALTCLMVLVLLNN